MALDTRINQRRRSPLGARRLSTIRPLARLRDFPGMSTLPSQQAMDAISHSPDFPRH